MAQTTTHNFDVYQPRNPKAIEALTLSAIQMLNEIDIDAVRPGDEDAIEELVRVLMPYLYLF
ncbi:hypothetical protein SAMN04487931_1289 [Desulfobacula phenolica]|uniref:Uncharacterized protein n=1 Tax=Desulfobacula phenolica TaxID=90732 RepID=A0A1H2KBD0_9BACT|nr:hypothetical protein SAMN04487931_1289 [Desulfobacula phenolica]